MINDDTEQCHIIKSIAREIEKTKIKVQHTAVEVEQETAHVLVINFASSVCLVLGYDLNKIQNQ